MPDDGYEHMDGTLQEPQMIGGGNYPFQTFAIHTFSWLPPGGSGAIYGREAGVALKGMKKQRRDRGW